MASDAQNNDRYKEALLADIREELQKVDTKSSILLATVSVIFAAFLARAISGSWSVTKITERGPRTLVDISLILGVIGLGLLGAAVKPRVHRTNQTREHLYFFGHVESSDPQSWSGRRDKKKCEEGKGQFLEAINASASRYDHRLDDQISALEPPRLLEIQTRFRCNVAIRGVNRSMCCSADLGANIMGTKDDIEAAVAKIFKSTWTTRNGTKVPEQSDIGLGNDGVLIEGTILYADLDGSTAMVDKYTKEFSAEIYKAYLDSTARIIRSENGEIVSFDGDRIMAVFIGDSKNTRAVRCGLKVNYSVKHLVMPALITQYPKVDFKIKHVVGIDTSPLLVARTGIRGSNDLVWVVRRPTTPRSSPNFPPTTRRGSRTEFSTR